jgi:hypothetical protein
MGGLTLDEVSQLRAREQGVLIGVCVKDFSLLHDILSIMRDRKISNKVLEEGEGFGSRMDALVLEDGLEPPHFILKGPVIVPLSTDPEITVERAVTAALGRYGPNELLVGVDPGKRPGVAFIADGTLVIAVRAGGPGMVRNEIKKGIRAIQPNMVLIRVGDGDPSTRDLIIGSFQEDGYHMEVVDESRTTKTRRFRDENSAVLIAQTSGVRI